MYEFLSLLFELPNTLETVALLSSSLKLVLIFSSLSDWDVINSLGCFSSYFKGMPNMMGGD